MKNGESSSENKGNYFHRYLNYAIAILEKYHGAEPLHLYLKKYFSANKKHGSKDRKQITSLCYNYFRVGMAVSPTVYVAEKLLLATFLVEKKPSLILGKLKPEWNEKISLNLSSKIEMIKDIFSVDKIFPYHDEISKQINFEDFCLSFLIQPKLFIRIRQGYKNAVLDKLKSAQISFENINENCLAFSNNEKVSEVINLDKEAVIQDYNSQQTLNLFTSHIGNQKSEIRNPISLWDCCAASGGKSILAVDLFKNINLTVSDSRKNILENLKKRFAKAGIRNYHFFVADLSVLSPRARFDFDFIIADVPCSGSGTWARTPEQLHLFSKKKIDNYSILQQKIVSNAIGGLNTNGYLLYITCSVFKKENEENVDFFQKNLNLQLIKSEYLKGYEMQADTLFAALFKKN